MPFKRLLILILALMLPLCAYAEEENPLTFNQSTIAHVVCPEGYAVQADEAISGTDPEYYLMPTDAESPVRFLYYTTGSGDSQALAEAAQQNFMVFYDEFASDEIGEITLAGRTCLCLSYTCTYPAEDGTTPVYEQSAICYFPVQDDTFVACILSLSFDSADDYLSEEEFGESLELMASAVEWME